MSPTPPRKIGALRRRSVVSEKESWVETRPLFPDKALPLLVTPKVDGLALGEWASRNREQVLDLWREHRALLFRGFHVPDVPAFRAFVDATSDGELLEYRDRTTPRKELGPHVYTSTVHPADQRIDLHNEGTYWVRWATKLYFYSHIPSETGGETPLADVRRVYDRIDPTIRARFEEHGMMLVRNLNGGFGLPWQDVFQTQDKSEVEDYCRANDIRFEWTGGEGLRTRQVRPAVREHPRTGEKVWFNHAAFFHYTSLEESVREPLLAEYGIDGLPYNTCYGDGTPIEPEVAAHLREAYESERVLFRWQAGDVSLLDNMTVAHAREPYTGEREVLVCMTEAVDGTEKQR